MTQFREALALADPSDSDRGALLLGLGEAAELVGEEKDAARAFAARRNGFSTTPTGWRPPRRPAGSGSRFGVKNRSTKRKARSRRALRLFDGAEDRDRVHALIDLTNLLALAFHDPIAGAAWAREASDAAERLGDRGLIASALRAKGNLAGPRQRTRSRRGGLGARARTGSEHDDTGRGCGVCAAASPSLLLAGFAAPLGGGVRTRLEFAKRCHDTYQLRHVHTWLAICAGVQGRIDESERHLVHPRRSLPRLASPEPPAFLLLARGGLAFIRGDLDNAETMLEEAVALFRQIGPNTLIWYLRLLYSDPSVPRQDQPRTRRDRRARRLHRRPHRPLRTGRRRSARVPRASVSDDQ